MAGGVWRTGLLALLLLPLALPWGGRLDDIGIYAGWGQQLLQGKIPYRDFMVEYPPLALATIYPAAALTRCGVPFVFGFVLFVWAVDVWARLAAWPGRRDTLVVQAIYTALQLPLYAVCLKRLDAVAAACVCLAIATLLRRPHGWLPWFLVAVATLIKLYPLVLIPALVHHLRQERLIWAGILARLSLFCGAVLAVMWGAALWAGPQSLIWLQYHHDRGLQATSNAVAWQLLFGHFGKQLPYAHQFGALEITAPWAETWPRWAMGAMAVAQALSFLAMAKRARGPSGLWRMALAHVLALVTTAKVGSPQYMLWLVAPAAGSWATGATRDWALFAGVLAIGLMTLQLYPGETLLLAGNARRQGALVARMFLQVALWLYLVLRPNGPPGRALTA